MKRHADAWHRFGLVLLSLILIFLGIQSLDVPLDARAQVSPSALARLVTIPGRAAQQPPGERRTLTTTALSGEGSLPTLLMWANLNPGTDTVVADIPPTDSGCNVTTGECTIRLTSPPPAITDALVLDLSTQPGGYIIVVYGGDAGPGANGIMIAANNTVLRGFVIRGFNEGLSTNFATNIRIEGMGVDSCGDNSFINSDSVIVQRSSFMYNRGANLGVLNSNCITIGGGGNVGKLPTQEADGGAGNTFAGGRFGVLVISGNGITISGNSIHSNSELGIDLGFNGVTRNDQGDGDQGANSLQNFPELTAASQNNSTTIQGRFNSARNTPFRLEFFSNTTCHRTGHGEGQFFLGSAMVTTNRQGNATLNITLPTTVPGGQFITATATNMMTNETSEFSQCVRVRGTAQPDVAVTMSGPASITDCTQPITYEITMSNTGTASALGVALSDMLPTCLTNIQVTPTQGRARVRGKAVSVELGTLDPGASATISITAMVNPACEPNISNTVSVSAPNDTNLSNNTATVNTSVTCGSHATYLKQPPQTRAVQSVPASVHSPPRRSAG